MTKKLLLFIPIIGLTACTPKKQTAEEQITTSAIAVLACPDFKATVYEKINLTLLNAVDLIDLQVLNKSVDEMVDEKFKSTLSAKQKAELKDNIKKLFRYLLFDLEQDQKITDKNHLMSVIAALSLGDRSTPEMEKLQERVSPYFQKIEALSEEANIKCLKVQATGVTPSETEPVWEPPKSEVPQVIVGARKAFSTAYQGCSSLRLNPMDAMSESIDQAGSLRLTPNPYGPGFRRSVTNLKRLVETHYYVKGFRVEEAACLDVTKNPMVYDYGGKPVPTETNLNFFANGGTGGTALGIDCSGFVFSAFANAGLKFKKEEAVRPAQVLGIAARQYMDPVKNGWTCFEKPTMGYESDIKPGDVVSSPYHVVIIETVGHDPLGIQGLADCTRVSYKNFNFTFMQSSPEKGSIGINRFNAKDYLQGNGTFRAGFEAYAQQVCRAVQNKTMVPVNAKNFSITRHKMTSECMQKPVALVGETCSSACTELYD